MYNIAHQSYVLPFWVTGTLSWTCQTMENSFIKIWLVILIQEAFLYVHTCITYVCTYIHTYIHTYIYIYICTHLHSYYTSIYIYAYAYIYIIIKKEEIEKDETIIEDNDLFKSFWQKWVLVVCIRVYTNWTLAYIGLVWALSWMKLQ